MSMAVFALLRRLIAFVLAVVLFFPQPAGATIMVYASVEELAESSDAIVHARVIGLSTEEDDDGLLWTAVQLAVQRTYLGEEAKERVIYQVGGEKDGRQVRIPGDAYFWVGQEAVLFLLEDEESGRLSLNGLAQGLFELRDRGPDGRQAERDLRGLSFYVRTSSGAQILRHVDPPQEWTIFEQVLERLIAPLEVQP